MTEATSYRSPSEDEILPPFFSSFIMPPVFLLGKIAQTWHVYVLQRTIENEGLGCFLLAREGEREWDKELDLFTALFIQIAARKSLSDRD